MQMGGFSLKSLLFCLLLWGFGFGLYAYGLNGSFLLDDLFNLKGLANINTQDTSSIIEFISGGVGAAKRPVSYLSFALQASSWPDPFSFKSFNLLLHLINTTILFALLKVVVNLRHEKPEFLDRSIPYLVAFGWLALSIHTSSVFYVIQRMAMLAAFWMLLGTLCYCLALRLSEYRLKRYLCFSLYVVCLFLGVLSKENAILLPLCILILMSTVVPKTAQKIPAWEHRLMIWPPLLTFLAYLCWNYERYFVRGYALRDFDLLERLLTQSNILIDYIGLILLPRVGEFRLMYENYPVVRNWYDAFPSILILLLIVGLAVRIRRLLPWFCYGILFFFACHLVESSVIGLELYFEHRNYLASAGLVIAVVSLLAFLAKKYQHWSAYLAGIFVVFIVVQSAQTYRLAKLWSSPEAQAVHWYEHNPGSHRAHGNLAKIMFSRGYFEALGEFYESTIVMFPKDMSKRFLWIELNCLNPDIELPSQQEIMETARNAEYNNATIITIDGILSATEKGACSTDGYRLFILGLAQLLENPNFQLVKTKLNILAGKAMGLSGNYAEALYFMGLADKSFFNVDVKLALAQIYSLSGKPSLAKEQLASIKSHCESGLGTACMRYRHSLKQVLGETGLNEWYEQLGIAK